ncbi:MAG: hypothetical protein ACPGUD_01630 [Parashewanella sp.]
MSVELSSGSGIAGQIPDKDYQPELDLDIEIVEEDTLGVDCPVMDCLVIHMHNAELYMGMGDAPETAAEVKYDEVVKCCDILKQLQNMLEIQQKLEAIAKFTLGQTLDYLLSAQAQLIHPLHKIVVDFFSEMKELALDHRTFVRLKDGLRKWRRNQSQTQAFHHVDPAKHQQAKIVEKLLHLADEINNVDKVAMTKYTNFDIARAG